MSRRGYVLVDCLIQLRQEYLKGNAIYRWNKIPTITLRSYRIRCIRCTEPFLNLRHKICYKFCKNVTFKYLRVLKLTKLPSEIVYGGEEMQVWPFLRYELTLVA